MKMSVINTILVAWRAILTNKSRSLLTMLGVIIGVGSVILLTSLGNGIQSYIEDQFDSLGSNQVLVFPVRVFNEGGGFNNSDDRGFTGAKQLSLAMARDLSDIHPGVTDVLPEYVKTAEASYKDENESTSIVGTTANYPEFSNRTFHSGRFFTEEEQRASERVAVLGYKIADTLFGKVDPVGRTLRINNQNIEVVGVVEEIGGTFGGPPFDDYIFIPVEYAFKLFDTRDINSITLKVAETDQIPAVIDAAEDYMENVQNRDEEEYDVFDQRQILNTINQILGVLTAGLGGIAAISLVVGGIGIMNIMLVSVTERTREIGLRKALGATPNVILLQFLIESSLLSVLGGGIGILIATLGSFAIRTFADFPSQVTPDAILLAFGVSLLVGVVFGVAPARKASKLSPIEALRSE